MGPSYDQNSGRNVHVAADNNIGPSGYGAWGVHIGKAVVAAGSLANRDVPPLYLVAGVLAKVVRRRRTITFTLLSNARSVDV